LRRYKLSFFHVMILKGTGANLDYPYPYWFGSMPAPEGLNTLEYEDLPDYILTFDPAKDLQLLEKCLISFILTILSCLL